jgi:acyl dehydratase
MDPGMKHAVKHYAHLADLQALVGQDVGVSDWVHVEQSRIQAFADATGDQQWIHTDPARAATGPFKTPIAHGFLTLSLLPMLFETAFVVDDVTMGVNYGLNRVRFTAPVPVGSRLRGHFKLQSYDTLPGGAQLTMLASVEIEGSDKPACVAQTVTRRYVLPA